MVCERSKAECYGTNGTGSYDAGEYMSCLEGAPYKKGSGYQVPALPCYGAQTLQVNSITATKGALQPDGKYYDVTITVSYTGTGTFRILKDGFEIHRETVTSGSSKTYVWGFLPSNTPYQICAEPV